MGQHLKQLSAATLVTIACATGEQAADPETAVLEDVVNIAPAPVTKVFEPLVDVPAKLDMSVAVESISSSPSLQPQRQSEEEQGSSSEEPNQSSVPGDQQVDISAVHSDILTLQRTLTAINERLQTIEQQTKPLWRDTISFWLAVASIALAFSFFGYELQQFRNDRKERQDDREKQEKNLQDLQTIVRDFQSATKRSTSAFGKAVGRLLAYSKESEAKQEQISGELSTVYNQLSETADRFAKNAAQQQALQDSILVDTALRQGGPGEIIVGGFPDMFPYLTLRMMAAKEQIVVFTPFSNYALFDNPNAWRDNHFQVYHRAAERGIGPHITVVTNPKALRQQHVERRYRAPVAPAYRWEEFKNSLHAKQLMRVLGVEGAENWGQLVSEMARYEGEHLIQTQGNLEIVDEANIIAYGAMFVFIDGVECIVADFDPSTRQEEGYNKVKSYIDPEEIRNKFESQLRGSFTNWTEEDLAQNHGLQSMWARIQANPGPPEAEHLQRVIEGLRRDP